MISVITTIRESLASCGLERIKPKLYGTEEDRQGRPDKEIISFF